MHINFSIEIHSHLQQYYSQCFDTVG